VGVPLILAGPGVARGQTTDFPVGTEDLFPTLLGLTRGHDAGLPGLNLAPFLHGGPTPDRDGVLLEFVTETRAGRGYYDETWRGIRTRRHKYTVLGDRSGARPWQLYDLATDPYERTNLIDDPAARGTATDLHRRLGALLAETGDDYAVGPAFGIPGQGCVAPSPPSL